MCKTHTLEYARRLHEIQSKQFHDENSSERRTAVNNIWRSNSMFFGIIISSSDTKVSIPVSAYLTIRLRAWVFYKQIVNEAQPSWLSLVENEGE